jgi:hypothetical protein
MREVVEILLSADVAFVENSEPNCKRKRGSVEPSSDVVRVYLTTFLGGVEPTAMAHLLAKKRILDWVTSEIQVTTSLPEAAAAVGKVRRLISLVDNIFRSCEHLLGVNYVREKAQPQQALPSGWGDSLREGASAQSTVKNGFDDLAKQVSRRLSQLIAERLVTPTDLETLAPDIRFLSQCYTAGSTRTSTTRCGAAAPTTGRILIGKSPDLSVYRNDFEVHAFEGFRQAFSRPSFAAALGTTENKISFARSLVRFASEVMHESSGTPLMTVALSCLFSSAKAVTEDRVSQHRFHCLLLDRAIEELKELFGLCCVFGKEGEDYFLATFFSASRTVLEASSGTVDGKYVTAATHLLDAGLALCYRALPGVHQCIKQDLERRGPEAVTKELPLAIHKLFLRQRRPDAQDRQKEDCLEDEALPPHSASAACKDACCAFASGSQWKFLTNLLRIAVETLDAEAKSEFCCVMCRLFALRFVSTRTQARSSERGAAGTNTRRPLFVAFRQCLLAEQRVVKELQSAAGLRLTASYSKLLSDMENSAVVADQYNSSRASHNPSLPFLEKVSILGTTNAYDLVKWHRLSSNVPPFLLPACTSLATHFATNAHPQVSRRKLMWALSKMLLTVQLAAGAEVTPGPSSAYVRVVLSATHFSVLLWLVEGPTETSLVEGLTDCTLDRCTRDLVDAGLIDHQQRRLISDAWCRQQHPTVPDESHDGLPTIFVPPLDAWRPVKGAAAAAAVGAEKRRLRQQHSAVKLEALLVRLFKQHGTLPRDPQRLQPLVTGAAASPVSVVDVQRALEQLVMRAYVEPLIADPSLLKFVP